MLTVNSLYNNIESCYQNANITFHISQLAKSFNIYSTRNLIVSTLVWFICGILCACNSAHCSYKSLGGSEPYCPVGLNDDSHVGAASGQSANGGHRTLPNQRRARVLCSYDAKDATELNLSGNEVKRIICRQASIVNIPVPLI